MSHSRSSGMPVYRIFALLLCMLLPLLVAQSCVPTSPSDSSAGATDSTGDDGDGGDAGDSTGDGGDEGDLSDGTGDDVSGTADDDDSADGGDGDAPSGPPTGALGSILVQTITDADGSYYDVYNKLTHASVSTYNGPNAAVSIRPGTYYLTEYFNADFVYDDEVVVTSGATTTVSLGAIKLLTVTGASDGSYGIYNAAGTTAYATYNDPNIIVTAPAGTFTLKEYFNANFTYASNVSVVAGETTEVQMGGIKLVTVANASDGSYAICDETGGTTYANYNDPNVIITAPAGTFVLKEYFNPDWTYASSVVVAAGATTTVTLGAIRYNGSMSYDIYSGGALVSSYNEAGLIISAPAGTYTLTKYFDADTVLATGVVVTAGAVTDVP